MYNIKRIIYFTLIVFFITGCNQPKPHKPSLNNISDIGLKVDHDGSITMKEKYTYKDGKKLQRNTVISKTSRGANKRGYEIVPTFTKEESRRVSIRNSQREKDQIQISGNHVKISVEEIPINQFIDFVFSQVLKLNYTVSKNVRKLTNKVTLDMSKQQPRKQFYSVIKKILSLNGVGIRTKVGTLFLYKKNSNHSVKTMEDISIGYGRTISPKIPDDKMVLQFVPYYYIKGGQLVNIVSQIGIHSVRFTYTYKGLQIIQGKAEDIRKVLNIAQLVDRPYLQGKKIYLIDFQEIEASKFKKEMTNIFNLNGISVVRNPTKSGIVMSPIPAINSMLVVSPKKSWVKMLLYWKKKLDAESQISSIPKFYTYKVQNRKADELAKALNGVIDLKLSKVDNKLNKKTTSKIINHTIKFDLATNTLMLKMLPSEYREILPLIEQLDALPKQVLVEVTLAEVTLTDNFSLGFEYALRNNNSARFLKKSKDTMITNIIKGASGITSSYLSKNIDAIVNAYAGKKLLRILSKPKLLILNNETGNINVGTKVPVITSQTSANDIGGVKPSINQNIKYITTGVIAGLSPTINSNGILTMKVNINLSGAQTNNTSGIDSPIIVTRNLSTTLTLKSGSTVLLGGLISTNKSSSNSGIPLLKDVPIVGSLFKSDSDKTVKTELIMLIKPTIMRNTTDLNDRTRKFRKVLHLLDQYSVD